MKFKPGDVINYKSNHPDMLLYMVVNVVNNKQLYALYILNTSSNYEIIYLDAFYLNIFYKHFEIK